MRTAQGHTWPTRTDDAESLCTPRLNTCRSALRDPTILAPRLEPTGQKRAVRPTRRTAERHDTRPPPSDGWGLPWASMGWASTGARRMAVRPTRRTPKLAPTHSTLRDARILAPQLEPTGQKRAVRPSRRTAERHGARSRPVDGRGLPWVWMGWAWTDARRKASRHRSLAPHTRLARVQGRPHGAWARTVRARGCARAAPVPRPCRARVQRPDGARRQRPGPRPWCARAAPRGLPTCVGPRPAHPHPRQPPSIARARARAMPLGGPPARPNSPFLACRLELRGQNPSVAECRVCRSELGRAKGGRRPSHRRAPVDAHPIDAQGNPHPSLGGGRVSCRSAVRRVGRTVRFWPVGSSRGAKIVGSRSAERQVFKRGVHRDSASSVRVGQVWPWAVRMDFSSSEPWCLA